MMLKRILIFFILSAIFYLISYGIKREIKEHTWSGFGVVDHHGKSFDVMDFKRTMGNLEVSSWQLYAYYEMSEIVFCFTFSMLICDYLTVCFRNSYFQFLDLTPFVLGFTDLAENICILVSIIMWPYGFSQELITMASSLSYLKVQLSFFVLLAVVLGTIWLLLVPSNSQPATTPKPTPNVQLTEKKNL